jgi:DNA gyrase/topoisomerase IV subunit A
MIDKNDIGEVVKYCYKNYAIEVIEERAVPDLRDGLKPVQRKIVWAMYQLGMLPKTQFKKCARIVGEVIGKYSPHGDASSYSALVRMSQNWILNHPLIEGHGNFGQYASNDPAAAMRYTEARLEKYAMEFLADADPDVVVFKANFDGTEKEPSVLSPAFPNILVNGASGIAVGIACNIPPHNLMEACDATIALIKDPNSDPLEYILGPDFPTGGYMEREQISEVVRNGIGTAKVYSEFEVEKTTLKITSIPYGMCKDEMLGKNADKKRSTGIVGVIDESQTIEVTKFTDLCKKEHFELIFQCNNPELLKEKLLSVCSNTHSYNLVVLDENKNPRQMKIKEILIDFIKFRREVVFNRLTKQINKLNDKIHLLNSFLVFSNVQELTDILVKNDIDKVKAIFIEKYKLDNIQIDYILSKNIRTLIKNEFHKIEEECNELKKQVTNLEENRNKDIDSIIINELNKSKELYGHPRKTKIIEKQQIKQIETNVEKQFLIASYSGLLKRCATLDGVRVYNGDIHSLGNDFVVITSNGDAIRINYKDVPILPYNKVGVKIPGINSAIRILPLDRKIEYLFALGSEGNGAVLDTQSFKNFRLNKPYKILKTSKMINAFFVNDKNVYDLAKMIVWGKKKFISFNINEVPIISPGGKGVKIFTKEEIIGCDIFVECFIEDENGNFYQYDEGLCTGRAKSGITTSIKKVHRYTDIDEVSEIWENGKKIQINPKQLLKRCKKHSKQ